MNLAPLRGFANIYKLVDVEIRGVLGRNYPEDSSVSEFRVKYNIKFY